MIDFEPIEAVSLDTGGVLRLSSQLWDCVIPCIVIGHKDGQPVLQVPGGPRVNDGSLIRVKAKETI